MDFNIYTDESYTHSGRFMLIGGLWVPKDLVKSAQQRLTCCRINHGIFGEMKWGKVSRSKLPAYKEFVNCFLKLKQMSFRFILIDKSIVDYRKYHEGDKELGFYKFYFLIISRYLEADNRYWLYVDERVDRKETRLTDLHRIVNRWCQREIGSSPLRSVEPKRSHDDDLVQLADVILGAFGYTWNQQWKDNVKWELVRYIGEGLGHSTMQFTTSPEPQRVNVWPWRPS